MILLVDKPGGMTSQAVVSKIKHAGDKKIKIGHTGTLDPMCTGLLPVLIGNDTKLTQFLPHQKSYDAVLRFGLSTTTGDVTGEKTGQSAVPSEDEVRAVLPRFIGKQNQLPPMYSAVHVNGKRLYELAREGVDVKRDPRSVEIYELTYTSCISETDHAFSVTCSGGTYIRTLCEDIASALGLCGTMAALRRTCSNGFYLKNAYSLEYVLELASLGRLSEIALSAEAVFAFLPAVAVPENGERYYRNGGSLTFSRFVPPPDSAGLYRIYAPSGVFLGLGQAGETGEMKAVFSAE